VGVVYGSPVVTVTQLLRRAVLETGRVSKDPPPIILFKDFGNSALVFEVHFWIHMRTMMDRLQVESSIRYQIEQLFKEEGIVVAFPQQDVHLDTSSPLSVRVLASPQDSAYS
jgi:small-conductance mechanosensitive channel